MTEISVMFEGGAMRRFPVGTTAGDALREQAEADGGRKAVKRAIAARVENGQGATVIDLSRPLPGDCKVAPVAPDSAEGLEVILESDPRVRLERRGAPGAREAAAKDN